MRQSGEQTRRGWGWLNDQAAHSLTKGATGGHRNKMMRQTFTVAQANALIPWLTDQFAETRRLAKELRALRLDRKESVAHVMVDPVSKAPESTREELGRQIGHLEARIHARLEETTSLGIEVRRVDGLCDFPAWVDGQMAFLCWKFGEQKIAFWHPSSIGFEGRRALTGGANYLAELN